MKTTKLITIVFLPLSATLAMAGPINPDPSVAFKATEPVVRSTLAPSIALKPRISGIHVEVKSSAISVTGNGTPNVTVSVPRGTKPSDAGVDAFGWRVDGAGKCSFAMASNGNASHAKSEQLPYYLFGGPGQIWRKYALEPSSLTIKVTGEPGAADACLGKAVITINML